MPQARRPGRQEPPRFASQFQNVAMSVPLSPGIDLVRIIYKQVPPIQIPHEVTVQARVTAGEGWR